jgi:hypothetical protein
MIPPVSLESALVYKVLILQYPIRWIQSGGFRTAAFRRQIFHRAESTGQLVLLLAAETYPYVLESWFIE